MERTPLDRFRVRLAHSADDYEGAFRLVQSSYVSVGIENVMASAVRITDQHVLPEAYVLLAEENGQLVGTMTVTLDSPAGLPLDKDYPDELVALRLDLAARLCEFGSLAVVERCRHAGVTNLINMAAFTIASTKLQASHVVLGVNPRAQQHYRATYDATRLGAHKRHAKLVAPVAGMVIGLETLPKFMRAAYPTTMPSGYLAADHFFGAPLPCIDLPKGSHQELMRWKLSREVFQEVFLRRSDRLATLDDRTRAYLHQLRTAGTIGHFGLSELSPEVIAELDKLAHS